MPGRLTTPAQMKVLRYLRKAEEEGRAPSFREMAGFFGWKAVSTARDHVAGIAVLWGRAANHQGNLKVTETNRVFPAEVRERSP